MTQPTPPQAPQTAQDAISILVGDDKEFQELADVIQQSGRKMPTIMRLTEIDGRPWVVGHRWPTESEVKSPPVDCTISAIWQMWDGDELFYEVIGTPKAGSEWEQRGAGISCTIPAAQVKRVQKMWALLELIRHNIDLTKTNTRAYLEDVGLLETVDDDEADGDGIPDEPEASAFPSNGFQPMAPIQPAADLVPTASPST